MEQKHQIPKTRASYRQSHEAAKWILFDGDNTLWHIEAHYDSARSSLVQFIEALGFLPNVIEDFQREEDKRLFEIFGYSATRFSKSFQHTLLRFVPKATEKQMMHVKKLAQSVFEKPGIPDQDVPHVLELLKRTYRLALVTAGERWVQERRIAAFRYVAAFDAVRIVNQKNTEVFRRLSEEYNIENQNSWVIGDSIRSDIVPALHACFNAILIANHNWIDVEHAEICYQFTVVDRLQDVIPIIMRPSDILPRELS